MTVFTCLLPHCPPSQTLAFAHSGQRILGGTLAHAGCELSGETEREVRPKGYPHFKKVKKAAKSYDLAAFLWT
ncbi:hypothetical protein KL86CLO1_10896 [uncultured Eubacteriales bacterium]|uniref:Uncharacterized protein n=1 Tax=uncultured Eubacteriales bacterium TaxID=172733 RepID=A0A212JD02_9FIRM|nr:hypothetical protein KL86CLO1_10896 [uncultured Eubacteriales bacterium]